MGSECAAEAAVAGRAEERMAAQDYDLEDAEDWGEPPGWTDVEGDIDLDGINVEVLGPVSRSHISDGTSLDLDRHANVAYSDRVGVALTFAGEGEQAETNGGLYAPPAEAKALAARLYQAALELEAWREAESE